MAPSTALSEVRFTLVCVKTANDTPSNADVAHFDAVNSDTVNSDLVEVACVKLQGGRITETLHLGLNPHSPVDDVLQAMASFVGRDVLIWVNSGRKANAVHRHFKLTQARDRQFFLKRLAQKVLPHVSSHGLPRLATHFGLETDGLNRIENAGIIAAKVFSNLLSTLEKQGVHEFSQLLSLCPAVPQRVRRTRDDLVFDRQRLKDFPERPGVYFMKNRIGEILYIGKAKNLKKRLKSYFQKLSRLTPKIAVMMRQLAQIDVTVVGSELEALLLESRLIKQHQPFFNQKVKDYQRMVFLAITVQEAFPRLLVVENTGDPTLAYVGPFRAMSALKERVTILNRVFQLRDCSDAKFQAHRQAPCMQYQLGLCSGPCAGKISEADYQALVDDFLRFLRQQPCNTVDGLVAKRDAYTDTLRFEKAALVQAQLEQLAYLSKTSERLIEAVEQRHCLIVLPGGLPGEFRVLSVLQGQPHDWQTLDVNHMDWEPLQAWIADLLAKVRHNQPTHEGTVIAKIFYEEARLIDYWLRHRADEVDAVIPLGQPAVPLSVQTVFHQLLLAVSPETNDQLELVAALEEAEESWHWEQDAI